MTAPLRVVVSVLLVVSVVAGCAARPRQRPLPTSRIEQGPGSLEAVRKALAGRWVLIGLEVSTADGRKTPVEATGLLTSDEFGGLTIEYRMSESGQKALEGLGIKAPNPVISTTGRIVIDAQEQRISYVDNDSTQKALGFDPDLAARRANPFALERARYYTFEEDGTLTLATRHDNGNDASVSRWKRAS